MNVFLTVLNVVKIIAVLACVLLGTIAFALGLVLFIPFEYDVEGNIAKRSNGSVKISWLWKVLQIHYIYGNNDKKCFIKLFFFSINNKKKKKKEKKNEAGKDYKDLQESHETRKTDLGETGSANYDEYKKNDESNEDDELLNGGRAGFFKQILEAYNKLVFVIQYPERREITRLTGLLLVRIWKAVKPGVFRLTGRIGLGDPYSTGIALGVCGVFMAFSGWDIRLAGNFEQPVVDIKTKITGKIMLWAIIWPLCAYILKKPIWKIVRLVFFGKEEKT